MKFIDEKILAGCHVCSLLDLKAHMLVEFCHKKVQFIALRLTGILPYVKLLLSFWNGN